MYNLFCNSVALSGDFIQKFKLLTKEAFVESSLRSPNWRNSPTLIWKGRTISLMFVLSLCLT